MWSGRFPMREATRSAFWDGLLVVALAGEVVLGLCRPWKMFGDYAQFIYNLCVV